MFCRYCGAPVGDTDKVCSRCGSITLYGEEAEKRGEAPAFRRENGKIQSGDEGYNFNNSFDEPNRVNPINPDGSLNPNYKAPPAGNPELRGKGYYYNPQSGGNREQQPVQNNGFATAGFVLGLLSVIFGVALGVLGVLGLVFSIIGVVKGSKPNVKGKGLAIAGIVLSAIGLLLFFAAVGNASNYEQIGVFLTML